VTGLSFNNSELAVKGMQLLRESLPGISRVGVLSNAANPAHEPQVAAIEGVAPQLRLDVLRLPARGDEFAGAFQTAARGRIQALFVLDDTALTRRRGQILDLAAAHSLPVVSRYRDFAEAGGLIAYGPNLPAVYRRAAYYVDRILKGAKPGDLPVEQPTTFELVINLKTAKALGLTIPPSVLVRADHVIE
jgi:putative ABC transport system substrate-binding protein